MGSSSSFHTLLHGAILLARAARYPAQAVFTLAHEIGHAALGHLGDAPALVDMEDPFAPSADDDQEIAADRFALELLTGSADPDIRIEASRFSARSLALAVSKAGPRHRIEPATLALCVGYKRQAWQTAIGALRVLDPEPVNLGMEINRIAAGQLTWNSIGSDSFDWVERVLGL